MRTNNPDDYLPAFAAANKAIALDLKHDWFIASLRGDPRYAALLKKSGLPR